MAATDRRALALRVVLGGATILMFGLSRPLWAGQGAFPRVPFLPGLAEPIATIRWLRFAALLATVALGAWRPRFWLGSIALLAWMVAEDQHRFQAWAYQFALVAFAFATLPSASATSCARIVLVGIYVHSGLSKLDASFASELGPLFLSTMLRPFGFDVSHWPADLRTALSLLLPLAELLIGLGLIWPPTRRPALAGVAVFHLTLIAILGPWPGGLGHSTIVLVWNAALLVEAAFLFHDSSPIRLWSKRFTLALNTANTSPLRKQGSRNPNHAKSSLDPCAMRPQAALTQTEHDPRSVLAIGLLLTAALILPFAERSGLWDAWPSFALYASHVERVLIDVHESDRWPPAVRRRVAPSTDRPGSPWHRLDLTAWSRAERGTPPYPQARAALGVAESLARWGGRPRAVRVILWGPADRFSGLRQREQAIGLDAIRRLGDHFRLNAHPAVRPGS